MQMLQEESELLNNQKEQIEKSLKSFHTMTIHKIDDSIFEMNKEKQNWKHKKKNISNC